MRLAGLRSLLCLVFAVVLVGAVAGCDNPLDPLKSSDKIEGLTYFDFSATQEHWDTDPEWDGLQITMNYYNEFSDTLNFHDKSHKIQIDIYLEVSDEVAAKAVTRSFLVSKTVDFENSDDFIRIPIEYYGALFRSPIPLTRSRAVCRYAFSPAGIPAEGTRCPPPVRGDPLHPRGSAAVDRRTARIPGDPSQGLSRFSPRAHARHSRPRGIIRSRARPRPDPRAAPPGGGIRARRHARGRTR